MQSRHIWLSLLMLVSCAERAQGDKGFVDLCRPANTPPGTLSIGDMEVAAGGMDISLDARGESGWYGIWIALDPAGADRLAQVTRENIGRPLALSLDGDVIAEPVVQTPILDGRLVVSGNFTRHEAGLIVQRLSAPCETIGESGETRSSQVSPAMKEDGAVAPSSKD